MEHDFNSEESQTKRTTKGERLRSEKHSTMFCPNCSGSGRYFYVDRGVNVCKVCGGSGLTIIEKNGIHEERVTVPSFN